MLSYASVRRRLFQHDPNTGISSFTPSSSLHSYSLPRYMLNGRTPARKEAIVLGRLSEGSDVEVFYHLPLFQAVSWESGDFSGTTIKDMAIAERMGASINLDGDHAKFALHNAQIGSLNDATWNITGNLGKLTVEGTVENCTIRTTGDMGALKFKSVIGSDFLAGCGDSVSRHATSAADFENSSTIKSVNITGEKGSGDISVSNSNFSASRIGIARFGHIEYDNSDEPFGLFSLQNSGRDAGIGVMHRRTRGFLINRTGKRNSKWTPRKGPFTPIGDFTIQQFSPAWIEIARF